MDARPERLVRVWPHADRANHGRVRPAGIVVGLVLAMVVGSWSPAVASRGARPRPIPPARGPIGFRHDQRERESLIRQFRRDHMDTSGRVRPDLWRRGVQSERSLEVSRSWHGAAGPGGSEGAITGTQWSQIGPAPLRIDDGNNGENRLFQGTGPDSGEVVDIAIDPSGTTDQTIYIATNDGGVWKTTNGGASWAPKTDFRESLSMGALVIDPSNPSIVYAGTGNRFDGGTTFSKGVGIYRSTDGGDTWTTVGASVLAGQVIIRMVMPASGTILVATHSGLYRSVDSGTHFGNNAPSYDNGLPVLTGFITDLHLDTVTPTTVYAAVAGSGIWKSTDSGATFPTNLFGSGGLPATFWFIAFTQSKIPNSQTMYANVQTGTGPSGQGFDSDAAGVYKSVSGGAWQLLTPVRGCQCAYDQTIGVDPQNASRLYAGWQQLFLSTNGGASFRPTPVTQGKVHWDHHALVFSPQSHWGAPATRLYVGTDGGIATSGDGGVTWANINEGIATNLLHVIDIGRGSASNNQYTYGTAQDTGTSEHRPEFPGADWHLGIDGDGAAVTVDPTNPLRAYSVDDGLYIRTTDGGATWALDERQILPDGVFRYSIPPGSPTTVFAGSVRIDSNGDIDYQSPGPYLYRSTNSGDTFTKVFSFPSAIWWIAAAPSDPNTLWVGLGDDGHDPDNPTDTGYVYVTHNALAASPTWTGGLVPGHLTYARVTGVAVDPTDPNTAVVTFSGFCGGSCSAMQQTHHVFLTTNSGASWSDISGTDGGSQNLPDLPTNAIVIDPGTTPHSIIVADDAGVLRSLDTGATWQVLGTGLPTVDSTSLALDGSASPALLRVGTYGRSAFELRASTPAPTISSFAPTSGSAGTSVTITGTNFTGATAVKFNGTAATFAVNSATQITATVASGATSGPISVTTPGGTATSASSFTITSGGTQLLGNPGFENGDTNPAPWVPTAGVINSTAAEPPHSGTWDAWLDGYGATHTDTLYQDVALPTGISSAPLTFFLHIDTADTGTTAHDTLKVQIRSTSGTVLATLATYSNLNAATGYSQKTFDLTAFAGQTIRLFLVGKEDASLQTSFVVDDFALTTG
jgi:hypothetical protein